MTNNKHEPKKTSTTPCSVCREWERDMNGTLEALKREREIKDKLVAALKFTHEWFAENGLAEEYYSICEHLDEAIAEATDDSTGRVA